MAFQPEGFQVDILAAFERAGEQTARFWAQISLGTLDFHRAQRDAAVLARVTLPQVLNLLGYLFTHSLTYSLARSST